MTAAAMSPIRQPGPMFRFLRARPEVWLGLPWLAGFALVVGWEFHNGFVYKSNDTTNIYLRLARGSAFALLPVLAALWLPVMRNAMTLAERSRLGRWLPLEAARASHRWLGHLLLALSLLHGSQYLIYYGTLKEPFTAVLFGTQPDIVRSAKTNMYDFVTDDADIEALERWIAAGTPHDLYLKDVQPFLQKDCTKCHNTTSTRSYARTDMPMTTYEEAVSWTRSDVASRQFRINVSGLVMLALFAAVWVTSLAGLRHRNHPLFQTVHRLGYLCAILALLHIPSLSWIVGPVLVLAAELYLSRHRRLYRDLPARVTPLTEDVARLEIDRPQGMRLRPGHYVQLRIREFGRDEWHAFSLIGADEHIDQVVLKVRAAGDWTNRLVARAATDDNRLTLDMRGPYASPVAQAMTHGDWLLIAGGIGVTPFLGLLRELIAGHGRRRDVHVVWMLRNPKLLHWLEPLVHRLAALEQVRIHWHVYVTRPATELHPDDLRPFDGLPVGLGRPDWDELLARISLTSPRLSCFLCGPHAMMAEAADKCRRRGWPVRREAF